MSLTRVCTLVVMTGMFGVSDIASAQSSARGQAASKRQFESRTELEQQQRSAESRGRSSEAWLLRSRLTNGDFQEGDRIVVTLNGATVVTDTVQVRAGRVLPFAGLGEVSLTGVLRAELTDTVRSHLAKYLNNPVVRVTPLLPLAVLGEVAQPGFYYVAADVVLRDVIMRAGGPIASADLSKIVIRRSGELIWDAAATRIALTDGLALDGLHLRAGDEIMVPRARRFDLSSVTTIISATVAITLAVVQLSR